MEGMALQINSFHASSLFPQLLKLSENLWFSDILLIYFDVQVIYICITRFKNLRYNSTKIVNDVSILFIEIDVTHILIGRNIFIKIA